MLFLFLLSHPFILHLLLALNLFASIVCELNVNSSICLNLAFKCAYNMNVDVDDWHPDPSCVCVRVSSYTFDLLINFNSDPNEAFKTSYS